MKVKTNLKAGGGRRSASVLDSVDA